MSKPLQSQDAECASLLAEIAKVSGRDDVAALMADETVEALRADLASRRRAIEDVRRYGRLGAIWKDDRAVVED